MWMSPVAAWASIVPGRLASTWMSPVLVCATTLGDGPATWTSPVSALSRSVPSTPSARTSPVAVTTRTSASRGTSRVALTPQGSLRTGALSQWSSRCRSAASPLTFTCAPPHAERFSFVVSRTSVRSAPTIRTSPVPVSTTIVGAAARVRVWVSVRCVSRPTALVAATAKSTTAAKIIATNTGREMPGTCIEPTVGARRAGRQPVTR